MSSKIALRRLRHTHRVNSGIADQYCNCQQQNGRKDFTDTVNQLTRRNRQPISHAEKHQAEYGQCDVFQDSSMKGEIAVSKDTVAVRGMANKGPIAR